MKRITIILILTLLLPLGLLATAALFACPCRLLLGLLLPALDRLWASLLAAVMRLLGILAESGADTALCLPVTPPPAWTIALYHAAFALWLLADAARHSPQNDDNGLRDAQKAL